MGNTGKLFAPTGRTDVARNRQNYHCYVGREGRAPDLVVNYPQSIAIDRKTEHGTNEIASERRIHPRRAKYYVALVGGCHSIFPLEL